METFIGVITKILDPELYQVEVDIPERNMGLNAFPLRGEVDEPRVGDIVFLRELDSVYHSYYLYEKLKENKFIGIRALGKKIKITKEEIEIGVYDMSDESWYDASDGQISTPECTSWIRIDSKGNIKIEMEGSGDIHLTGDSSIKVDGSSGITVAKDAKVDISGNSTITVSGDASVESPNITVKGEKVQITGGQLTVNGSAAPTGQGGFCAVPACIFSGAPHIGTVISGT